MALTFKIRDLLSPPSEILMESRIKRGDCVLDYGFCPGSFSIAAAEIFVAEGKVYALDASEFAVQHVRRAASEKRLSNLETIRSDCPTELQDSSVDAALFCDTFHDLSDPSCVLKELHRVIKPSGILSFSDRHMKEEEIISGIANNKLFRLSRKGKRTYSFSKE